MPTTAGLTISVSGSPVGEAVSLQLVSAWVDTHTGLPDSFALRFRDNAHQLLTDGGWRIGVPVTIAVATDAHPTPVTLLDGEVTAVEAEFSSTGTFTTVRGYDQSHRLFRGRHTAAYTQTTASDAARRCARNAGLRPGRIEPSSTVYDHISQRNQTDWEFLSGLARGIGYRVGVHDGALDFAPPVAADTAPGSDPQNPLVLEFGTDIIRLRSAITAAEQVGQVEVRGWDTATKQPIVGTAAAATSASELADVTPSSLAGTFGNRTHVVGDRGVRSQAEADTAARARSAAIAGGYAEVDALCSGNPTLKAGIAVSLNNLGAPFDGKFVLTSVRHNYDATTGYTTTIGVSASHDRSLLGLTAGGAAADTTQRGGVVIGQVTDVHDPEHAGRVKLSFPQLSADYVSGWARTVVAGAGKGRGALILPEVGDEVLVAFEQGDGDHPYVIGGLFNGVDTLDSSGVALIDDASGAVNRRSIVSRRGHRIDLNDQDGRTEGVELATGDGALQIAMDATGRSVEVHSSGTVSINAANGITIDAGAGELAMRGGRVSVSATSTAQVTASGPLTVQGNPIKLN